MEDRPLRADVPPQEDAVPVDLVGVGEPLASDLDDLAAVDRSGRVGRTTTQVGVPAALVVIGAWAARLADLDLNPLPGVEEMPADVVAAFVAILTVALARRMNRPE